LKLQRKVESIQMMTCMKEALKVPKTRNLSFPQLKKKKRPKEKRKEQKRDKKTKKEKRLMMTGKVRGLLREVKKPRGRRNVRKNPNKKKIQTKKV